MKAWAGLIVEADGSWLYFLLAVGELRRCLCDGFVELVYMSRDIVDLMGVGEPNLPG